MTLVRFCFPQSTFDSGDRGGRAPSPNRCDRLPHPAWQGSGLVDDLARYRQVDHSERKHQTGYNTLASRGAGTFEEAGIKGTIVSSTPLGMYTYSKKLGSGEARAATVEVFLLHVQKHVKKWPEKGERQLAWVSAKKAISLIEEPGVVPLLVRLMETG